MGTAKLSEEQKERLKKEAVYTKEGEVPLDEFLLSVSSGSQVDTRAYFSLVGIVKELLIS